MKRLLTKITMFGIELLFNLLYKKFSLSVECGVVVVRYWKLRKTYIMFSRVYTGAHTEVAPSELRKAISKSF
jgi:hypothetical protein